jgi:hypothetical protein
MYDAHEKRFVKYCRDGDLHAVRESMELMRALSKKYSKFKYGMWPRAMNAACRGGHIHIATYFMSIPEFDGVMHAHGIAGACNSGSPPLIDMLVNHRLIPTLKQITTILLGAAQSSDIPIFIRMWTKYVTDTSYNYLLSINIYSIRIEILHTGNYALWTFFKSLCISAKTYLESLRYDYHAAYGGNMQLIDCILTPDSIHWSDVILGAVQNGHLHIIEALLKRCNYGTRIQYMPVIAARGVRYNQLRCVHYALQHGAPVTYDIYGYIWHHPTEFTYDLRILPDPDTLELNRVICHEYTSPQFVRFLIAHHKERFTRDIVCGIVSDACSCGKLDIIVIMCELYPNTCEQFYVDFALRHEHMDIVKYMLENKARIGAWARQFLPKYMSALFDMGLDASHFKCIPKLYSKALRCIMARNVRVYHCAKMLRPYGVIDDVVSVIGLYIGHP